MNLADLRKDYSLKTLDICDVDADPVVQFKNWFQEALNAELPEPSAMHLATVNAEGKPSGRVVLLKHIDTGFVFFTNYNSRKGQELEASKMAALTFFWPELERQVRIEGCVERVENTLSDEYFNSRPKLSRIGAIASAQSTPLSSRESLEAIMQQLMLQYSDSEPQRPEHWGGYRLLADYMEFWQGRRSRLHDRIAYQQTAANLWQIVRLAP